MQKFTCDSLKQESRFIKICIPHQIPMLVDLKTHTVLNWVDCTDDIEINEKVCDTGTYTLLDENKQEFYRITGYVPNQFLPDKDGFGDYLHLCITSDGVIDNWYENPDFSEFVERGYCTLPITKPENIYSTIEKLFIPFYNKLNNYLKEIEQNPTRLSYTTKNIVLSAELNNETDPYSLHIENEQLIKDEKILSKMPNTKSVWIHFYTQIARIYDTYIHIWTKIEFREDSFFIEALNKEIIYNNPQISSSVEELFQIFKCKIDEFLKYRKIIDYRL